MKALIPYFVCGLVAIGGCAHGRISDKVNDIDFAKLDAGQTKRVQAAREELSLAQDEVTRAKVKQTEALREAELGDADRKVADAVQTKAKAESAAAEQARDAKMMEQSKAIVAEAELRGRAADAHRDYAKKLMDAREAAVDAAEVRLELATAKVELAKLQSLEEFSPAAMAQYDSSAFFEGVADKQREWEKAQAKALRLDEKAKAAQGQWEEHAKKVPESKL